MTKPIDMMTICVKDKGFTLAVTFKSGTDNRRPVSEEHAYSNLDDLQAGIADLLGPPEERVMISGVDFLDGGEMPDDDGWREWEGGKHASDYPPGVDVNTEIEIVRRDGGNWIARAGSCNWSRDLASAEIVRYRVVKP